MKKFKLTPILYIYLLFAIGISLLVISIIASNGTFLSNIVYDFSYFVDFFDHVKRFYLGLETVYSEGMHACFPPLAYCMYYIVSRILFFENASYPEAISTSGSSILIICMMIAIFSIFFVFAFFKLYSSDNITAKKIMSFLLFCSYPFWLAIERGNMVLIVLILLMYAFSLMDSESKTEREIALILFAIAAGLKIYPAIFGLLYLITKKYKEAMRLLLYGIIFFFLPFVFFKGIDGFRIFLHNITAVSSGVTGVTIVGLTGRILSFFGIDIALGNSFGQIISYIYFVLVIFLCFIHKKTWKTIALLTSLMIVFVAASGTYCLIYWVIPFIYFLNDLLSKKSYSKADYLYATLFSLVFVSYPINALGSSGMLYIMLYLLLFVLLINLIHDSFPIMKRYFISKKRCV